MANSRISVFLGGRHAVQPVMDQGAKQTVSTGHGKTVSVRRELHVQVKNALRHRPAKGEETTQLGRSEVGHKQRIRADREWGTVPQFVGPQFSRSCRSATRGPPCSELRAARRHLP